MLLVQHGHVRGPVQLVQIGSRESLHLLQRRGIGHHQHPVVLEGGAHGVGVAVLRNHVDLPIVEVHVLRHIAQLGAVDTPIGIVQHVAFGSDVDQRAVLGGHVAFVQYESALGVVKGHAVKVDAFRREALPVCTGGGQLQGIGLPGFCRGCGSCQHDAAFRLVHRHLPACRFILHNNIFHALRLVGQGIGFFRYQQDGAARPGVRVQHKAQLFGGKRAVGPVVVTA